MFFVRQQAFGHGQNARVLAVAKRGKRGVMANPVAAIEGGEGTGGGRGVKSQHLTLGEGWL
jgi:hypothetical protein